jgi:hypothetical protein
MENARKELIDFLSSIGKNFSDIAYGRITLYSEEGGPLFDIKIEESPSEEEWEKILKKMDIEYDSGYGVQYLLGTIVFKDGSWLKRVEYDGSEWWEYYHTPSKEKVLGG